MNTYKQKNKEIKKKTCWDFQKTKHVFTPFTKFDALPEKDKKYKSPTTDVAKSLTQSECFTTKLAYREKNQSK